MSRILSSSEAAMTEAAETRSFPASKSDAATSPARGGITLTVYLMSVSEKRFLNEMPRLTGESNTPQRTARSNMCKRTKPSPASKKCGRP